MAVHNISDSLLVDQGVATTNNIGLRRIGAASRTSSAQYKNYRNVSSAASRIHCGAECVMDPQCLAFIFDRSAKCCSLLEEACELNSDIAGLDVFKVY